MDTHEFAVEILQNLVRQPSLSGQEGGVVAAAEKAMKTAGFDRVWRDVCGNLVGELHGLTPGGKLMFDAHLDVVPAVNPQTWQRSPFSGDLAEERVWGRGATDNKGSMAAMITSLGSLDRNSFTGTIYVIGSVGEETFEGIGLQQLVDVIHPQAVVVGEPTNCRLGFGQRGRARITFRVPGTAAHSSADDQSGNAVYALGRIAARLSDHGFPTHPAIGKGSHAPIEVISNPFPSLSTVPVECRLTLDRRLMPGETEKSVLQDYGKVLENVHGATVEMDKVTFTSYTEKSFTRSDFHPAWDTGVESDLVRQCQDALRKAGIPAELYAVPYCTNASYSAGVAGIPAVVYGPGDIAQAHTSDEFIELSELRKAAVGYKALAIKLSDYYNS